MKYFLSIALYLVFCALLHGGENLSLKTCGLKHAGVEEQLKQLFTDAGFSVNAEKGRNSVCIFAGRLNQPELAAAFRKYLPGGELKYDGFAVAVDGNQVYLIGGEERSLIYAAADFLEKQCGYYRSVRPVEGGTPEKQRKLANAAWISNPAFALRGVSPLGYSGLNGMFMNWELANAYNFRLIPQSRYASDLKSVERRGYPLYFGGHTFYFWIPGTLFKEHPEYFPLIKGKRTNYEKPNYSVKVQTNVGSKEVQELVAQKMIRILREHPDIKMIGLGMNDGAGWGDSPEERAMDDEEEYRRGVYSTRYFRFANIVAEKVAKVFPDVKIHTYAYFSCEEPPKLEKLHPNLIIEFCTYRRDYKRTLDDPSSPVNAYWNKLLLKWLKFGNALYIRDYLVFGGFPAFDVPVLKIIQRDLQYYRKIGVTGYYTECMVDGCAPDAPEKVRKGYYRRDMNPEKQLLYWTGMKMEFHLLGRLLWNPDADLETLKKEYFKNYYGAAAEAMEKIYRRIEQRWDNDSAPYVWNKFDTNFPAMLFQDGDMDFLEKELAKAVAIAEKSKDPVLAERLKREEKLILGEYRKRAGIQRKTLSVGKLAGDATVENVKRTAEKNQSVIRGLVKRERGGKILPSGSPADIYCAVQGDSLIILGEFIQKKVSAVPRERDGQVWKGNDTFELFLAAGPENAADGYYQLVINPLGDFYDSRLNRKQWNCNAKVNAGILADRWFALISIPLSELGYPRDKAAFSLRMNFGRNISGKEVSSWTDGSLANESAFGILKIQR